MILMPEYEAYGLFSRNGIAVMPCAFAKNIEEACEAAEKIGWPLVAKISSEDIVHKSDIGGVIVGIANKDELKTAFKTIIENAEKAVPGGKHAGILITPLIKGGIETVIGAGVDPEFGRFIMFGLGGIFVELYRDVSFRMVPVSEADAREMIAEVKAAALLSGYRGHDGANIGALVDLIVGCSRLMEGHEEICEMDLNPVMARKDKAYILDGRVFTK